MIEFIRKLSTHPLARSYAKVFSIDVLVKGTGIILLPVYLRLMTQEEYGMFGYVLAIINSFSLVFNLGIYASQSKLFHQYGPDKRGVVLYSINVLLILFITLLMVIVLVFRVDFPAISFLIKTPLDYSAYRETVLLGVIVSVYSLMLVNYFLTSENIAFLQRFNIARILLINGVVITLLFLWRDADHTLIRLKYSFLVEIGIIIVFSFYYVSQMRFTFDKEIALKALKISVPILISAILGLVINLSDRFFIEKHSLKDLSVYNLAVTVAGIIPFVFASFQSIWLPQFLKEKDFKFNRERSHRITWRLLFLFIVLSILIMVLLKVLLMTKIIDSRYSSIMPLLPFVLVTSIFASLTPMFSNHLIYLDKTYIQILVGIPIACLSVGLNLFLVPRLGVYGAALTTGVTSGTYLASYALIVNYFYNKKL